MGYVGSRMRRLEDPQVASAVGHCAGHEEAPRPALDVRGPLAGRHAVLGAVDAGDGLAADYNGTGLLAGGSQFRGSRRPADYSSRTKHPAVWPDGAPITIIHPQGSGWLQVCVAA